MNQKLLMVGCGKMGGALLGGFLGHGLKKENVTVVEPAGGEHLTQEFGVNVVADPAILDGSYQPDIIIFAVKPQMLAKVLPEYKKWGNHKNTLAVSVAAGAPVAVFAEHLGKETPIVRLMPNLPALVGAGMTGAYACPHVANDQKKVVDQLISSVGEVVWVEDEEQMHAITAISGSGPAYLFHFIEGLEKAGKALGLTDEAATTLANQMVYGSAKMAIESDKTAEELRIQVTSPNGTTAAALEVLMQNDAQAELLKRATQAASNRSVELSKE